MTATTPRSAAVTVGWRSDGWRTAATGVLAALSAYSTGVAWQAQAVSYPLFAQVSPEEFGAYHLAYNASIPLVVIVPGFVTFLACAAYPWLRPSGVPASLSAVVSVSGVGAVLTTVLWAIPRHDALDRIGQDGPTIASLLQANAVRTALLTVGTTALVAALVQLASRRR